MKANFTSYSEAINTINITKFKITESVNTSRSSWVRGAFFYSCDKITGYFIIKTDNGSYIYKNLPISVWISFKNASSFGSYYDKNIRNRYKLYLTGY
jgi:hypothetical protein